jgi:hypothetical protein
MSETTKIQIEKIDFYSAPEINVVPKIIDCRHRVTMIDELDSSNNKMFDLTTDQIKLLELEVKNYNQKFL